MPAPWRAPLFPFRMPSSDAPRRSRAASRSAGVVASVRLSRSPCRPAGEGPSCPGGTGMGSSGLLTCRRPDDSHAFPGLGNVLPSALDAGLLRPEGTSGGASTVSARAAGLPGASSATTVVCGCSARSCAAAPTAARAPTGRRAGRVGPVRIGRRSGPWLVTQTHTHPLTAGPECGRGASCCAETGLRLIHVCSVSTDQALAAALRPVERGFAWLKSWRIFCRSRRSPNRMA